MSDYEKHIGKLKKIDLSEYDGSTEKFFEEQYRKLVPHLSEEKIKDEYSRSENSGCRRDAGLCVTPNFRYEPTFEFYEDDIETIKRLQEKSGDFDFPCLTE